MGLCVLLLLAAAFEASSGLQSGMAVAADASAISVLFGRLLADALAGLSFDSEFFGPVAVGPDGRTLSGTVSIAGGISCQAAFSAATVPVGVLANASACGATARVAWSVAQNGRVLCSNTSLLVWKARQVLAYMAISANVGIATSRVEVNGGNTTAVNTTCSSAASTNFIAVIVAKLLSNRLDAGIAAALSAAPFADWPDIVLSTTFSANPVITRTNVTASCAGTFHQRDRPAPSGLSCYASPPPWPLLSSRGNFAVRLFDCFFDSLWRQLFDQGLFEGRIVREFIGLQLQLYLSAQPFKTVLRAGGQAAVNATLRIEVVSGDDSAIVHANVLLPVNATTDGAVLRGSVPDVKMTGLNATMEFDQYHLPIDMAVLQPLLLDVLQNEVLPVFNKMLAVGIALPLQLPSATVSSRVGFLELLAHYV